MQELSSAYELLQPNEKALVIYTDGRHLTDNGNGTGSTGWWKINHKRKINRVIVYHRKSQDQTDNSFNSFVRAYQAIENGGKRNESLICDFPYDVTNSMRDAGTVIPPQMYPRIIFTKLFGDSSTTFKP